MSEHRTPAEVPSPAMTDLPEPLTPPDCDLRDFAFMPLDVLRLRDSDLAAIPDAEAFRASVIAWCVSWHQVPAASLPDDDAALCRLLGYGRDVKGWQRIRRAGGLHGWRLCSDGRLYHPVVAEKANEAWAKKQSQRERSRKANAARWGSGRASKKDVSAIQQGSPDDPTRMHDASHEDAGGIADNVLGDPKGQGQGQGQGEDNSSSLRSDDGPSPAVPPPPPDARTVLWSEGLARVRRITGLTDARARSLLGQWSKLARDDCALVSSVLHEAEANRIGDPIPWVVAAIKARTGQRGRPARNLSPANAARMASLQELGLLDQPTTIDSTAEELL